MITRTTIDTEEERASRTGDGREQRPPPVGEEQEVSGGVWGVRTLRRWWRDPIYRRRLLYAAAALVVLLLLVLAFRPSPIPVESAPVTEGRLEITIDSEGTTQVVDRYQLAAPITGRLQRVGVEEGDAVGAGETLARITPAPLDPQSIAQGQAGIAAAEARLAEATAALEPAREAMEQAQLNAERAARVVEAGGLSREAGEQAALEATRAEQQYEAAQARVSAARSEVEAARAALLDVNPEGSAGQAAVSISAPAAGRVLRVHERSERVVPAGTPLIDVGDAAGLEVVIDVLSTEAVRIEPGAPMRIEDWGGGTTLLGQVRRVEPSAFTEVSALGVEEQRVNVIGDLFNPPPALGDGYRVEAQIVVWADDNVIKVPSSALFQRDGEWAVFAIEGGQAVLRTVEIGQRGTTEAQVIAGLVPGETVVLFPSDQLEDGAAVTDGG